MPICDVLLLVTIEERIQGVLSLGIFNCTCGFFLRSCLERKITDYSSFNRGYRKIIRLHMKLVLFQIRELSIFTYVCKCLFGCGYVVFFFILFVVRGLGSWDLNVAGCGPFAFPIL